MSTFATDTINNILSASPDTASARQLNQVRASIWHKLARAIGLKQILEMAALFELRIKCEISPSEYNSCIHDLSASFQSCCAENADRCCTLANGWGSVVFPNQWQTVNHLHVHQPLKNRAEPHMRYRESQLLARTSAHPVTHSLLKQAYNSITLLWISKVLPYHSVVMDYHEPENIFDYLRSQSTHVAYAMTAIRHNSLYVIDDADIHQDQVRAYYSIIAPSTIDCKSIMALRSADVLTAAQSVRESPSAENLGILCNTLEDQGCSDPALLLHCIRTDETIRGSWLADILVDIDE